MTFSTTYRVLELLQRALVIIFSALGPFWNEVLFALIEIWFRDFHLCFNFFIERTKHVKHFYVNEVEDEVVKIYFFKLKNFLGTRTYDSRLFKAPLYGQHSLALLTTSKNVLRRVYTPIANGSWGNLNFEYSIK